MSPAPSLAIDAELGIPEFRAIAAILQEEARITLGEAKVTLVQSRLAKRLRQHGLGSYRDYLRLVRSDEVERGVMVTALTTNHTHFFRENHHFEHLVSQVLPHLKSKKGPVRIWSAGCSSGEEVYSIAMCLLGQNPAEANWIRTADVRLLATDISLPMVEAVHRGIYPEIAADAVPLAYRGRWMREAAGGIAIGEQARALVTARVLNLFDPWPMQRQFDVIFCRNVMIYFDEPAKRELEERLVKQLVPGGHLYIGHSERLGRAEEQGMRSCGQTIYRKEGASA